MRGLLGYIYVVFFVKFSNSFVEVGTPLNNDRVDKLYITRVDDDLVLLSKIGDEYDYLIHPGKENAIKKISNRVFDKNRECSFGVECPMVMNVGETKYRVSQGAIAPDKISVINLINGATIGTVDYKYDFNVYTIKQLDDESFLILGLSPGKLFSSDKGFIERYNLKGERLKRITFDGDSYGIFVTKNAYVLLITYSDKKVYAKFYSKSDLTAVGKGGETKIKYTLDNSQPYFYITELNDKKIIACHKDKKVKCFSGLYDEEKAFKFINSSVEIEGTSEEVFKIVQFQGEYAMISQGLKYTTIDFNCRVIKSFTLDIKNNGKSFYGDFIVLNDYRFLFLVGIYEENSNNFEKIYQVFYQTPYCENVTLYPKIGEEYPLTNLFSFENTKSKRTQGPLIKFEKDFNNSLFMPSGINSNQNYVTEELKFKAVNSTKVSFLFQVSEPNFGEVYDKWCSAVFIVCYDRCENCSDSGNEANHNCDKCKDGYYKINFENSSKCLTEEEKPDGYYIDEENKQFLKCHENCKSCSAGFDETSQNCDECIKDFYFEKEGSKNCTDKVAPGMYKDTEDRTLKKCYESCSECGGKGTKEDHNCTKCDNKNYFKLIYDNKTFCYKKGEERSDYYFDESDQEFKKCFANCSTCFKGEDSDGHNCKTCKDGLYKWKEDEHENNCYDTSNLPKANLYLEDGFFHLCHERCETCLGKGTQENSNCTKCNKGYFFFDNEKNCSTIEDMPEGYYFDKENELIKKCHKNCTTCENGGTEESSNCVKCAEGFAFSSKETGKCISITNKKDNEYVDENGIIKECHKNCGKCLGEGTDTDNNCEECLENYAFIDGTRTCMSKKGDIGSYYFDEAESNFKKCYDRCLTCSNKPDDNFHNCKTCQEGLIYTSSYTSGSCLNQEEISVNKDELQKFIPISPKSSRNKTLTVLENYTFFYYTTDTSVQSTDIPYVLLGECEMELKEHYDIPKNEKLYIGLILDNTNSSNMTYSVYSSEGRELDLSVCSSVEVLYPINKNKDETGLLSLILSNPKKAKRVDLYNPEDSFYTNPCDSFEVEGKEVSLEERQEMFNNEMQFCPPGCSQKDYSLSLQQVSCTCEPAKEVSESDSLSSNFTSFQVQVDSLSLFKCTNLLKSFPGKSYLQWSTVGSLAVNTAAFLIMQFSLGKMISPMPNPNSKKKSAEKWIEMKDNSKSINDYSIQVRRRKSSRMPYLNKDEDEDEQKDEYKSSNFSNDFCEFVKRKLFILSVFTNAETNFLFPMRVMLHLTTVAVILFVNAFLYKKDSFMILNSLYAFLIGFVLYKIGYETLSYFCKYSKKIRIISVVEFSISTILCFVIWYYVYIFGVVFEQHQGKMLFLFLISILFFVAFQICFALLTALIKSFGYEPYSKCVMAFAAVLDKCS